MGMVVQHNITAMNSNRMLGQTVGLQAKSTEKLSSGYKINRAADDASGLAISEKMRKQIRGLTQASANAQDGISAVQTAEGALAEVQDMLQRMNELAVKSANGTNSESDRTAIQNEIDQLTTEIDRVAETTKFNETYLLKGDANAAKGTSYAYKTIGGTDVKGIAEFKTNGVYGISATVSMEDATKENMLAQNDLIKSLRDSGISVTGISEYDKDNAAAFDTKYIVELNGAAKEKYDITRDAADAKIFNITTKDGIKLGAISVDNYNQTATPATNYKDTVVMNATTVKAASASAAKAAYYDKDGNKISENDLQNYFSTVYTGKEMLNGTPLPNADAPYVFDAVGNRTQLDASQIDYTRDKVGTLSVGLHVGADATKNNQITMNIENISSKGLGINGLKIDGTDDSKALDAIEKVKAALSTVSAQRASLGAIQNRLEHTIKNLDNVVENTQAAESQIRDTDMASEMVQYSKNQILTQAGQSMLAQANQSNQGVLSLLG